MAVKRFKGKDRRIITKCKGAINALNARDIIALDTTVKSQAISTRTTVLAGQGATFDAALALVVARLQTCLDMVV